MEVKAAIGDVTRIEVGGIIIGIYEGQPPDGDAAAVDVGLGGIIGRMVNDGDLKGGLGQVTVLFSLGKIPPGRVAVVGLGKREDLTADRIRTVSAEACRALLRSGAVTIGSVCLGVGYAPIESLTSAQAITEGALLGLYSFRKHMTATAPTEVRQLTVIDRDAEKLPALEEGVRRGRIVAEAVDLARDLVNEPANLMTPADLANVAIGLAKQHGLDIAVLERDEIAQMGMGAFLGVAQGSDQPPKLVVMRYAGRSSSEVDIALVGKGITFDSGGISIKPTEGMGDMKGDMAGGASVISAISAIAQLRPRDQRDGRRGGHRKSSQRFRTETRRYTQIHVGQDHRDSDYRRGGTFDSCRCYCICTKAKREGDCGRGDSHRRSPRGSGRHLYRRLWQQSGFP